MKQSFRYVMLLIATLMGTSAFAADWNIPEPGPSAFVPGDTFAIRNVGVQCYIFRGEAWGTQACVNSDGQAAFAKGEYFLIAPTIDEASASTWGSYYILFDNHGTWGSHRIWRQPGDGTLGTGVKGCFVDNAGNGATSHLWDIQPVGNNKYTIGVPPTVTTDNGAAETVAYFEGEFLGVQLDHEHTANATYAREDGLTYGIYYDVVYADNPENCQWEFINKKDIDIYDAKVKLAGMCDDAAEVDINTDAYAALVNNANATLDELNAAIAELTVKLKEADSWNYPTDITEGIIKTPNPYQGHADGWTVRDAEGNELTADKIGSSSKEGDWYIGEFWSAGGYSISQTITVPAGVYTLRCYAMTRTDMNAVLKAGENQIYIARVPSGTANNRSAAAGLFAKEECQNNISWVQLEDGDIEISLTADNSTGDHWMPWRNFELLDRGSNMRSYQKAAEELANNWQEEFIDENGEPREIFTQSYYDAIAAAVESIPTSTNTETALAIYKAVQQSLNDLRTNIYYYKELKARTFDTENYKYEDPYDEKFGAIDPFPKVWQEAADIFNEEDYTKDNEYLKDLYNRYMEARQNAIFTVIEMAPPGGSVTGYIENPSFKNEDGTQASFAGWTVASSSSFQNNAGTVPVIEQWNSSSNTGVIDVYQTVAIRKVGAYQLRTKGWYRSSTNQDTHDNTEGYQTVNTFLYGASSEYRFHDIYEHPYTPAEKRQLFPTGNCYNPATGSGYTPAKGDDGELDQDAFLETLAEAGVETVLPNNCTGANELFNNPDVDWYDMTCDFLGLGIDYPVKIGVRGRDVPGYAWLIWDDFEMIYLGNDLATMKRVAQATADNLRDEFYENGELKNPMSAVAKKAIDDCIDGIENPADVDALVEAYKKADDAATAARASIAAYKKVSDKLEKLNDWIMEKAATALEDRLNTAVELAQEVEDALVNGTIADDDVDALIKRIDDAIAGLNLPGNYADANDDNPINFTDMITNPKYINDLNAASTDGWTATGLNNVEVEDYVIGYAEGWGSSVEAATFDIYQDIQGLPEGTYEVKVNGLYRQGGTDVDAKTFQYGYAESLGKLDMLKDADKTDVVDYTDAGQFYAVGDGVESYKPFHRWIFIGTDKWTDAAMSDFQLSGSGSYYTYVDSLTQDYPVEYYFPNDRANLYTRAMYDYYENSGLYANVGEDHVLRIGARNQNAMANDWTPFSNWRLYYLGTESKHATDGIRETEVSPALRTDAIYSIDGRRLNQLQKGLNIVVRNGKAQKIMVK